MHEKIIGIMGAMPEEIESTLTLLQDKKKKVIGMRTFYTGKINNIPAVVVFSRWGKVAAATTISTLILEFKITELIFTGVAGAIHEDLKIGDVVIANRLVQHDMDARPIIPRFEIPLLGKIYIDSPQEKVESSFAAVQELLSNGHLQKTIPREKLKRFGIENPKVWIGEIASGDKFFSDTREKLELHKQLPNVLCVEMEGASVAQICFEYNIPFIIVRIISDSADDTSHMDFQAFIENISSPYCRQIVHNIFSQWQYQKTS